jgi:hypothetical protein
MEIGGAVLQAMQRQLAYSVSRSALERIEKAAAIISTAAAFYVMNAIF